MRTRGPRGRRAGHRPRLRTAPGGRTIPVTDADLDHLPLATAHAIELLGTLPAEAIDPRQIGAAAYYLAAATAPASVRPYVLLVEALARRSQVAIVKFAVRGDRERLGMLRPLHGALVLNAGGATKSAPRWASRPPPPRSARRSWPRPSTSSRPAASTPSTRSLA
ncbi:Ku protein [Streptomyces canus]|uniref:Ku protein n=1 Tax=Streptomyces canus TaxID=58343 RepID=UPI002E2B023D|nr:Ku protein [Streptomyces canus]